ncbi:MAG TPA: FAD-binding oxidoreductase [Ktedonobacteraceae bacterium]|nr:FAD-binding oxidoreductase [Ktedonobacteraceae bacterium]
MSHADTERDAVSALTMSRRKFLALCAVGTLSGIAAACQDEPVKGNKATPSSTPTRRPSPTRQPSPTSADWSELSKSLQGTLIRPTSSYYSTARQLFNPRFDYIQPAAIAYCVSPADVQTCIAFAQRFGVPLAARSGGHSYGGYSTTTGLVLDVSRMNTVTVDTSAGTASVGAGTRLIDVYAALAQYGLVLPAGTCPTVGIAGLALGGGVGVLGRKLGLTCDSVLAAQIVVADGRVLTCDTNHEPDLFWALRGGGGGNFGVVTSFTFRVYPVASLSLFTLNWPWSSAADVLDAWQNWAPQAPDELWSNCLFQATSDKGAEPFVQVGGVYMGEATSLNVLLQPLINRINAGLTNRYVSDVGLLDAMLYEANCAGLSVSQCHLPSQNPNGQLGRSTYRSKSDYFTHLLPRQGIDLLVKAITDCQNSPTLGEGGIGIDAFGGAINRVAQDATAFVHRNALFSIQYAATWNASDPASIVAANHTWLNNMWQTMRPYASGAAYQNYIDSDLVNWQQAYYGTNLPMLQRVKAAYDSGNFFSFAQSIPPATVVNPA